MLRYICHLLSEGEFMEWVYNDGGRADAGYKGTTGDCVARAIAIAAQRPYAEVYKDLSGWLKLDQKYARKQAKAGKAAKTTARDGMPRSTYEPYLLSQGWRWVPTMRIGVGCKTHLKKDELPDGRLIVRVSHHLSAVIDGVVYDTYDPSKDETRCVYGYFMEPENV